MARLIALTDPALWLTVAGAVFGAVGTGKPWKALVPIELMPIYPRWDVDPPSVGDFWPWLSGAAVLVALFAFVAVASWVSGEAFLAFMGALGVGVSGWVGLRTLFRG